jgi:Dna[CI] antecedent DciA-like protein
LIVKAHAIGSLIARLEDLKAIHMRATRLAALQRIYRAAISEELARRSTVVDERSGTLVIAADTSGVAAKLRQLLPRIVGEIVKSVPEVTAIRLEVQVGEPPPLRPRFEPRSIGEPAIQSFAQLRDQLPDSSLRQALSRLIEHCKPSDSENDPLQHHERKYDER